MAISTRNSAPGQDEFGINAQNSGENAMPNCTWYAYYRAYEEFGTFPVTYMSDAWNWINIPNTDGDWEAYRDSNWVPGDVLVFSGNHVTFVEGDGQISESVYTSAYQISGRKTRLNRSGSALDVYNEVNSHSSSPAYNIRETSISGTLGQRFWQKTWASSGSSWGGIGSYSGRLHCSRGGGGGHDPDDPQPTTGWVLENSRYHVATFDNITVCSNRDTNLQNSGDQDWPCTPGVYSQDAEDYDYYHPQVNKHWRTGKFWDKLYTYTYSREMTYQLNSQGVYVPVFSDWVLEDSATLSGEQYGDYDTSISGEIPGWKIKW